MAHQQDTFTLTAAVTEYVPTFPADDQAAAPAEEFPALEQAPEDGFVFNSGPVDVLGDPATATEPEYYLYWSGTEGDISYWLAETPLVDWGVLVPGGDALYARFGVAGIYVDMDIAAGYGGIRPLAHAMNPELWQDEYFAALA